MRNPRRRLAGTTSTFAIPGAWPPVDLRRRMTVSSSVAGRWRWRATSARLRDCRTPRSPSGLVARRRRSRRTSTTRPGEGGRGQGSLRGRVPRLRRLHAAAQRQGRRLRVLQGLPSRRDRAAVDAGAMLAAMRDWQRRTGGCLRRTTGHGRMRADAGERRSSDSRGRLALRERRDGRIRELGGRPSGGLSSSGSGQAAAALGAAWPVRRGAAGGIGPLVLVERRQRPQTAGLCRVRATPPSVCDVCADADVWQPADSVTQGLRGREARWRAWTKR